VTSPAFPALGELQRLVWRLIAAPEGVARGASDLAREGVLGSEDLEFLVPSDARMSAVERLDVYADMYFYRLRDALAEDFPKLAAWIGPARWNDLVTDYLLAHPPSHFSLRELGRALPAFAADHALARAWPGLADLARLEWARVDVFDETDAAPLTREALIASGSGTPDTPGLALVPAARVLRLDRAVLPLWKRIDEAQALGEDPETVLAGEVGDVLVWRRGFTVWHRSTTPDEARCLAALAAGASNLARLGEILLASQPAGAEPERASERLASLLGCWLRDEVVRPA
jgi:hypothetical protein